jgi:hypothetical protein
MNPQNSGTAFPKLLGSIAVLAVLVLLYFGLLLRDWHYIEDIRGMVVPFVIFGLFSGTLLSLIPWFRFARPSLRISFVFFAAALVASLATVLHICLITEVGFAPKHLEVNRHIPEEFYRAFACATVFFFACSAVCGFHASVASGELIMARLNPDALTSEQRHELLVVAFTAAIGFLGSISASLLGGK